MKNFIRKSYILTAGCLTVAAALTSCSNEEDLLFDKSSAERLEDAKTEYAALLPSAENGWILQYFADNEENPGLLYHFSFKNDNSVTITASIDFSHSFDSSSRQWVTKYKYGSEVNQETSLWEIISDNGPVLTFNSYNTLFHVLSAPHEDGHGADGDYEFVIMQASKDYIKLRGKKTNVYAIMTPLDAGTDPVQYLTELIAFANETASSALEPLVLDCGEEKYVVSNLTSGVMDLVPYGGDPITETDHMPFLITPEGIRTKDFYKGKNEKFQVQTFTFGENRALNCTDQEATLSIGDAGRTFSECSTQWTMDATSLNGDIKTIYDQMSTEITKYQSKEKLRYVRLKSDAKYEKNDEGKMVGATLTLTVQTTRYSCYYYLPVTHSEDGTVSMSFNGEGSKNALVFLGKCPAIQSFIDCLCAGPISASCTDMFAPTEISCTQGSSSFTLTR